MRRRTQKHYAYICTDGYMCMVLRFKSNGWSCNLTSGFNDVDVCLVETLKLCKRHVGNFEHTNPRSGLIILLLSAYVYWADNYKRCRRYCAYVNIWSRLLLTYSNHVWNFHFIEMLSPLSEMCAVDKHLVCPWVCIWTSCSYWADLET